MPQLRIVSTGEDTARIERMEDGFARQFDRSWEIETIRLGRVASLRVAYHNTARLVDNPDTVLLFAHQDVTPVVARDLDTLPPDISARLRPWVGVDGHAPWVSHLSALVASDDFGFAGVAGSRRLDPGRAWWQHEDLSGMVLHRRREGIRVNAFGPWGRALVLDGLCLVATAGTVQRFPASRDDLDRFHFYDMDLCLKAHQAGLRNWSLPLLLLHDSGGASSEDHRWQRDRDSFMNRHLEHLPAFVEEEEIPVAPGTSTPPTSGAIHLN